MIRLNVEVALYRRNSGIGNWPVVEVIFVSAITAAISYLVCGSIILLSSLYKAHPIPPDCFCTVTAPFIFDKKKIRRSKKFVCSVSRPQNSCRTSFRNVTLTRATIMACASKPPSSVNIIYRIWLLFSPTATRENVFLLILTAVLKIVLTSWTFGMMVWHFLKSRILFFFSHLN